VLRRWQVFGGFVRQYQVQVDPNKLLAYGIPLSTVIERVRMSTNEVGGRVLEFGGAQYMVRGLGYLRSLADLENVPVASKNGTPVLIKDLAQSRMDRTSARESRNGRAKVKPLAASS